MANNPDGSLWLKGIAPSLTVNDIEKSLAFYRDVLGFAVKERWEEDGKLRGAELTAGASGLMLGQDDWKKGRDRDKGQGVRFFCTTDQDIDALAARIKSHGVALEHEPRDDWGMRALALADPDGYKLTIARELPK
jgi:catechol 2,3-dioxygenase-like lactoylglutathione lyase family enzyme